MKYSKTLPRISLDRILWLFILSSSFALCLALFAEHFFGLAPCNLCLYQRKIFLAIIGVCLLVLAFFKNKKSKNRAILIGFALLICNVLIASYQVGIEKKVFELPTSCASSNLDEADSLAELKAALSHEKITRCDQPSFVFLGLSMAGWNIIYCLMLIILGYNLYRRKS